ncbi:MAG: hypothetical protein WBN66_09640 [Smithella sp.]
MDIDESDVLGAKIGYNHPHMRALGLELEYGYMNPDIHYYDKTVGDIKFNNFMFNVYAKIPVGIIHPYWGGGIGFSNYEISIKDSEGINGEDNTTKRNSSHRIFSFAFFLFIYQYPMSSVIRNYGELSFF